MGSPSPPPLTAVEMLRKLITDSSPSPSASPPPSPSPPETEETPSPSTPSPPSPPAPPEPLPVEIADLMREAMDDAVADNSLKAAWDSFLAKRASDDSDNLVGLAQMGFTKKDGQWDQFKDLIKRGVPQEYRPKIWAECSGANKFRQRGIYQQLLEQKEVTNDAVKQIGLDVDRTFSDYGTFVGYKHRSAALRNVLTAYSNHHPELGYCQGMNNLTATLLIVYEDEEDAFWVLVALIDNILPQDYYTSHLLVSRADQKVFQDLVKDHLPRVSAHLADSGVVLESMSFPWFLPLFTDCFPLKVLLRVWDVLFVLGHAILFRVGIALIKLNEHVVLEQSETSELCTLLKDMPKRVHNPDSLIQLATDEKQITVKERQVTRLRDEHVHRIQTQMEEDNERWSAKSAEQQ